MWKYAPNMRSRYVVAVSSSLTVKIRFFLISLIMSFPLVGIGQDYYYWCLRYRSNNLPYAVRCLQAGFTPGYLWVQENFPSLEGTNPYHVKGSDGVWVYSSSYGGNFELSPNDVTNMNNYLDAIENPDQLMLLDFNTPPDTGLPKLQPVGKVFTNDNGEPVAIVGFESDGERSILPVESNGDGGFKANGYDENGRPGVYYISPAIDGTYPLATFNPSGSGGDSSSPSIDTSSPSPIVNNIPPPQTDSSGNVSVNSQTITVSNGDGGQSQLTLRDYTPLLSQIAVNQIEGINRTDEAFSTLNKNLEKLLSSDSVPTVAELEEPEFDTDSVKDEANEIVSDVSRWDFSFGLGSNPIGGIITNLIGDPPTNFGSMDEVWSVTIPISKGLTVQSTFKLSDYFIPAFRSCILTILSIVFSIAIAKQISDAWS